MLPVFAVGVVLRNSAVCACLVMACQCQNMSLILQAGGKLRQQKITSLTELADFDMVINCGGLRGGKLFGDDKVIPIRCNHCKN